MIITINSWRYLDSLQEGDLIQLAGVGRGLHQVQDPGQPALDDEAVLLLQPTKPRVPKKSTVRLGYRETQH